MTRSAASYSRLQGLNPTQSLKSINVRKETTFFDFAVWTQPQKSVPESCINGSGGYHNFGFTLHSMLFLATAVRTSHHGTVDYDLSPKRWRSTVVFDHETPF